MECVVSVSLLHGVPETERVAYIQHLSNDSPNLECHFKLQTRNDTEELLNLKKVKTPMLKPQGESVYDRVLPASMSWHPATGGTMPMISYLREGFDSNKPSAWHRNEERQARGLWPVQNPATQLEGWERELVWIEILILSGSPDASFRNLAWGWGRDKGFHIVLSQFICKRHGDVERKKRVTSNVHLDLPRSQEQIMVASMFEEYDDVSYDESLAAEILDLYPIHEIQNRSNVNEDEDDFAYKGLERESGEWRTKSQYDSESWSREKVHQCSAGISPHRNQNKSNNGNSFRLVDNDNNGNFLTVPATHTV
jgi:hypothetical protein